MYIADTNNYRVRVVVTQTLCSAGFYSGGTSCLLCAAGTYTSSASAASTCTLCPAGTSSAPGSTTCSYCTNGFYSPTPGLTACIACPTGFASSSGYGATACNNLCARGYRVDSTQSAPGGSVSCVICSPGTYTSVVGATACYYCDRGTYSTSGAVSCTPCPLGTNSSPGASVCGIPPTTSPSASPSASPVYQPVSSPFYPTTSSPPTYSPTVSPSVSSPFYPTTSSPPTRPPTRSPTFPPTFGGGIRPSAAPVAAIGQPVSDSTISYTIQVGSLVNSAANSAGCSSSSKLSTCNVRSAWAYCMSLIHQQSCGNNAVVNCAMVLPSGTTSMISGQYGAMTLSTLTSWAAPCTLTQVSMSVVGSVTGALVALVQGDSTPFAFIDAENLGFLTLTMSDINVLGFGDGTVTFLSAVVVSALQAAVFQRVSFSNNKGYSTGSAVYATHMGPLLFTACSFINNQQVYLPPLDTPKHSDTDYYDTLLILLTLCIVFTNLYSLLCSS